MKYKLEFEKKSIEFELIRRKRKTICIKIEESGKVVVSAPLKTSKDYIMLVVRKRSDWIFEKQKEMIQRNSKKTKRNFTPGSTFIYLGKEYSFNLIFDEKIKKHIYST
ncbi:putative metal-dependent hydrolase [Clostridium beijerinckii]|nr:putative metal-dependent hydrolase [Clostridium beijerinckii]